AEGTVGRLQVENRLMSFVRERHKAPVVLELSQAVRIVVDDWGLLIYREHRRSVDRWYAPHPPFVRLDRPAQPHAVTQQYVAGRVHVAARQRQVGRGVAGDPLVPLGPPGTQPGPEVLE